MKVLHAVRNANRKWYSGYWLHALNKRIRFYHLLNDSADGSDRIWKPNRICVQCEQRLSAEGNREVLSVVSLHLQRWSTVGTCLPDGGSLMMLDSCPQRRHSASSWESYRWSWAQSCRGVDFTLVPETKQDSWIPTVDENWVKGPLLSTDRTPMRPCPYMQLTWQPSSPTLQHDWDLCGWRENEYPDCLYMQKTSSVKVTAEESAQIHTDDLKPEHGPQTRPCDSTPKSNTNLKLCMKNFQKLTCAVSSGADQKSKFMCQLKPWLYKAAISTRWFSNCLAPYLENIENLWTETNIMRYEVNMLYLRYGYICYNRPLSLSRGKPTSINITNFNMQPIRHWW